MTALILGGAGQGGYYLSKLLRKEGENVVVSSRGASCLPGHLVDEYVDVSDFDAVCEIMNRVLPDVVYNFAAVSAISDSYMLQNQRAIVQGCVNLFEAVCRADRGTKVFIAGSALQQLFNTEGVGDVYTIFRNASESLSRYFRRKRGLRVYTGRFFHNDSPERPGRHLARDICLDCWRVQRGEIDHLEIGNPDMIKEWNHTSDTMRAVATLVRQDTIYEADIGCGVGYSVRAWVELCLEYLGLGSCPIRTDHSFVPPFHRLVSDSSVIRALGWKPEIDIKGLCKEIMESTRAEEELDESM